MASEYEQASDQTLVSLTQGGDELAFAEIVRRYSPRVFHFASRFFRQRSLVEEAAQEVFLKAYTHLGDYEGRGSFEGWLTRITTNTCLNLLRRDRSRPESMTIDLSNDESDWLERKLSDVSAARYRSVEHSLVAADLADRVLQTLSAEDRLVLMLLDGEDAPVKEVAEMVGWSESKVKVRAFRARRRLRKAIEGLLDGTGQRGRSRGEERLESAGER